MTLGLDSNSAMLTGILDPGTRNGGGYSASGYTSYRGNSIINRTNENNVATSTNINAIQRNISSSYSTTAAEASLLSGDIDAAIETYKAIMEDAEKSIVSNYGYSFTDYQTKSIAGNSLNNKAFLTSIMENTNDSFMTGLLKGMPIIGAFTEKTSTQEAIAKLNGTEVSTKHKLLEKIGGVAVPAVLGVAAVVAGGPVGALAGLAGVIGLASGLLRG